MNIYAKVPLIIPAYEPDESLVKLLEGLQYDDQIIVVNDGSGLKYDWIYDRAAELGCTVLVNHVNMGKGRALKNAFNYCLNEYPNMIGCVTADSDGQHINKDIIECKIMLEKNPESLILGCRDFSKAGIPAKSLFGNNLTKLVFKYICGICISDTQTGLRGVPKELMKESLNIPGERFEFETRMLVESKDRFALIEFSIETIYDSVNNHQTHFDPIKDSIRIYKIFGRIFVKFLFSSLSSSVIDLCIFSLLCLLLGGKAHYILVATIIARVISATYNFLINYKIVFKSKENYSYAIVKYFFLAVVQLFISGFAVEYICSSLLTGSAIVIKIYVDVILFFVSYWIQRGLVYKS